MARPDGNGGWINDTKGITNKPLFRWKEVVAAMKQGREFAIVEGEKDADNLWKLGIPATCNFDGATDPLKNPKAKPKWKPECSEQLKGASLVVFNDNDPGGYAHANAVCKMSLGLAARVRRLDLKNDWPEIPHKGDVSDYLAAGHSAEQLKALIASAPEYAPAAEAKAAAASAAAATAGGLEDTVALDFAALHADDYRYVAKSNKWMQWNGTKWKAEDTLHAFDRARVLCREAGDAKSRTVAGVTILARSDRRLAATVEQWDSNDDIFNAGGVTVDLKTGNTRPPDRLDYCTKQASVAPAPAGTPSICG